MASSYLLPDGAGVVPPKQGWKEHCVYLVEVAYAANNPMHEALLHVGFLDPEDESKLGNYCEVWSNSSDEGVHASKLFRLEFRKLLHEGLE